MGQIEAETWTKKAPIPVAVEGLGIGVVDDRIYAIGGAEQRDHRPLAPASNLTLVYDPQSDRWDELAPLPKAMSHIGVTALDGRIYAIGGFTDIVHMGPQDLVFVYDPRTDRWSELARLAQPRGSVCAAAVNGKIHIFGGRICDKLVRLSPPGAPDLFEGLGTVTTHEIYDPATGRWSQAQPMPEPAADHMGIATLDGRIHLIGGRTGGFTELLDRHHAYDPGTDSWTEAAPLPRPRSDGAYTVLDRLAIYAGGECKPGGRSGSPDTFDDVTAYNSKTNTWSDLPRLPQACHGISAATVRNVAYFMGGACCCGGGASTDVFALQLPDPLAHFYGNTLNVVEPDRTLKLWYKADNTFTGLDEKGNRIGGTWERTGDRISMVQNFPAPTPGHEPWARNGHIGGVHKVGDKWERTSPTGARVYLSLTAGT